MTSHPVVMLSGDVSLIHQLDREERDRYLLSVMAQDAGGRAEFTTVLVEVEDVNDHSPEFIATGNFATQFARGQLGVKVDRFGFYSFTLFIFHLNAR